MDIWSAGCIMAEMITGKTLFKGSDRILHLWGVGWVWGGAGHAAPARWGGAPCSLAPCCAPHLSTDLDQLKEIMKVTGTPPDEFVQRLQSAEVSGELGGGLEGLGPGLWVGPLPFLP